MTTSVSEAERAAGRGYETLFVPALFSAWTPHVVTRSDIRPGAHVVDIACGTGVLARHVFEHVGRSGTVTGIDPAPGMIAAAQEIEPEINWIEASAEALPLEAATVDGVLSQFGMMFFADRAAAAAEMVRVLRPGGWATLAVWNDLEHNAIYREISALLDAEVSTAAGDCVRIPFNLGDASEVTSVLRGAGFANIAVETLSERARFPDISTMVAAELRGWLPLFGIELDEAKIGDVLTKAQHHLASYATATGTVEFPTSAHVIAARKPQ